MTLKGNTKFKRKLTHNLKNDVKYWFSCKQSKIWKFAYWCAPFDQSIWRFRWKSTKVLCLMTMKSDGKFEEKLTFCLKDDVRNLVNFKVNSGNLHFVIYFCRNYVMFELKNTEELCCEKWLMVSKMT